MIVVKAMVKTFMKDIRQRVRDDFCELVLAFYKSRSIRFTSITNYIRGYQ